MKQELVTYVKELTTESLSGKAGGCSGFYWDKEIEYHISHGWEIQQATTSAFVKNGRSYIALTLLFGVPRETV